MRISDWSSDVCSSDLPVAGIVPAQQRLGGDDRAVGKADLRLIDERELVALDRAAQIDLELRAIGKLRSEERSVGQECVSTCRSRWQRYHIKKIYTGTNDRCKKIVKISH